jgi:bifunctional non-homologous end joining protein LigD
MPDTVEPMLPTAAAGLPPDDAAWAYEMSWGGRRTQAYVSGGRVRLVSSGADVTGWYPELRPIGDATAPIEVVLDGEIVAFDGPTVSPDRLAKRREPRDTAAARRAAERTPVQFLAYDLLWLEGHGTTTVGYVQRRELLDGLGVAGDHWQTPPYFPGGGEFATDAAAAQGLAGVVAKRLDSPYVPGRRSKLWLLVEV